MRSKTGRIIFCDGTPRGAVFGALPEEAPIREMIYGTIISCVDSMIKFLVTQALLEYEAMRE